MLKTLLNNFQRRSNRAASYATAELHCHLEATVSPQDARKIAKRNNIDISAAFDRKGNYKWRTFTQFLEIYDAVSAAIRTADDYYEITHHHYERMARKGMIYGEVIVSPAHAMRFGLSYNGLIESVADAMRDAKDRFDIVGRIIVTCVRHFGAAHAREAALLAHDNPHPFVTGFGMAGDEAIGDARDYKEAFDIAHDAGLGVSAHAGEILGPESIRAAIDLFRVQRIGHGVRAIEDVSLIDEIRERGLVLEVCPTSNVAIGLYPSLKDHPLPKLVDAGLNITLNSDDPAFFGADVVDEYQRNAKIHGFDQKQLNAFTRTALKAAFCDAATKVELLSRGVKT